MNSDYCLVSLNDKLICDTEHISICVCPTCGKKFEKYCGTSWVYKKGRPKGHKIVYDFYCSWSCLRKVEDKDD